MVNEHQSLWKKKSSKVLSPFLEVFSTFVENKIHEGTGSDFLYSKIAAVRRKLSKTYKFCNSRITAVRRKKHCFF